MATYSTSQSTRQAFIMAAGALFAEKGVDAVGIREISAQAGENMGNIHYHFGGKKGLLQAVIDFALEPCSQDIFNKYIQENDALFASREGQARLVSGMINLHFKTIFNSGRPLWCGVLIDQLIIKRQISETNKIHQNFTTSYFKVYQRITGNYDTENAVAWLLTIVSPYTLLARHMSINTTFKEYIDVQEDSVIIKLRNMVIRSALANLNLFDEADSAIKSLD